LNLVDSLTELKAVSGDEDEVAPPLVTHSYQDPFKLTEAEKKLMATKHRPKRKLALAAISSPLSKEASIGQDEEEGFPWRTMIWIASLVVNLTLVMIKGYPFLRAYRIRRKLRSTARRAA
jgi:hypothetical protein